MSSAIEIHPIDGFVLSILVLFLGMALTRKISILSKYNIPPAVSGGIVCSLVLTVISVALDVRFIFDMQVRDFLLLVFFSCIGLGAKLGHLKSGGKALAILVAVAAVLLVLQDVVGVSIALLFGKHPVYGVIGGSASLAGGHGTAIAWGEMAEAYGFRRAADVGIAIATFGLIAGGLIGGPIAGRLIKKRGLEPNKDAVARSLEVKGDPWTALVRLPDVLGTLLVLAICVWVGSLANRFLFAKGVMLPGFLTSMMVAILLTNLLDFVGREVNQAAVDRAGEISLNIFLSMSLMSMQLQSLAASMGPILVVILIQMLVITLFVMRVVFKVMGEDYDAAVISAGFAGLGLGATPVAIANMSAITGRYGPSPKAFLVVPLIGAFFIDILNAGVIRLALQLIVKIVGLPT